MIRSLCLLTLVLGLCTQPLAAQHSKKAVTDLEQVDADFSFQGEYAGSVAVNCCWRSAGLQVVALGDGQFDALYYPGGLPGWGWDRTPRRQFHGAREGSTLTLESDAETITIERGWGTLHQSGGYAGRFWQVDRVSPTMGAAPPWNATVLFDGGDTDAFQGGGITPEGWLEVGVQTKQAWTDFTLHAEFRTPYMPAARGQARGNSGFYLQRRYEVQVLDSFGLIQKNNDCGALYKTKAADLNMSLPPLAWQTYDIRFTAARFDDEGNKTADARITVWHNGVAIHNKVEIPNKTGAGRPEGPEPLPILLQNHGNPVVFRNIWIVDHSAAPVPQVATACAGPARRRAAPRRKTRGLLGLFSRRRACR